MAKTISKITVRCPHCSAEQQEPELVKSTYCRSCSEYFAISPSTLAGAARAPSPPKARLGLPKKTHESDTEPAPAHHPLEPEPRHATGLLHGLFGSKLRTQVAACFECNSAHEVSGTAHSSTCKACGAYIDLQDYKISGSFSRNIKTRGSVYLETKGDLSSSKIICRDIVVHGKMRGNLLCSGRMTVKLLGRVAGSVEAGELLVEKGSEVVFSRPVKAFRVEIHGRVTAEIISQSHVTIHKHGLLDGAVEASGFTVEKGGGYQGELTISPPKTLATAPETVTEAPLASGPEARPAPDKRPSAVLTPLIGGSPSVAHG